MKIIKFKEHNVVYAEHQKEYLPLPALRTKDGKAISCWGLSFWERIKILFTGRIWVSVLTFNGPLQPMFLTIKKPFRIKKEI